jgi:hypothetical protein
MKFAGKKFSTMPVGSAEREGIRQMPDFPNLTFPQEHFHNIEPDFDLRILQQPQVIKRAFRNQTPLARIHGGRGAGPVLGRTGFHFDKDKAIPVAEDQIDFAAFGTEICGEKFQALFLEKTFGGAFPKGAVPQMNGIVIRVKQRLEPLPKVHQRFIGD